jgi:ABC-2 type transport system permease protein
MENYTMDNLLDMIWVEQRKALRSRMPLWTALVSLFMPLGIAFLIFVSRNPEISKKLGLVGAKANLMAYSGTDWPAYLGVSALMIAAGGFILSVFVVSWIFGREFSDGTVKDMLAVPIQRSSILLAKFIVTAIWSALLILIIFVVTLLMGVLIRLPGDAFNAIAQGSLAVLITAGLTILVTLPYALFASLGRGYLLPIGLAILTLMITNLVGLLGWGEYFPWAIPGLYAGGKNPLTAISLSIVFCTALAGMLATYLWWKTADQNR